MQKLLIANRGEIAVRIARTVQEMGMQAIGIHSSDDATAPHLRAVDEVAALPQAGVKGYLDGEAIIAAAKAHGASYIHPGYGFLSENPDFARAVAEAGLTFVGPDADTLARFGDKISARKLAQDAGVWTIPGTAEGSSVETIRAFMAEHDGKPIMIKAAHGGGGRGMAKVDHPDQLQAAYEACAQESKLAFGSDALYAELFLTEARHIEVQIVADNDGHVDQLGERECTIQRRNQKLIEIAPSPTLSMPVREDLLEAAVKVAQQGKYRNIGTFEFLFAPDGAFYFIEANPRLQVEHTVTEEVTGRDLVEIGIELARGKSLSELNLVMTQHNSGFAAQFRINAETIAADGKISPAHGPITAMEMASGKGVRVDKAMARGDAPHPLFDSLLGKLIVHTRARSFDVLVKQSRTALAECAIEGPATNLGLLQAIVDHPDFAANKISTAWLGEQLPHLARTALENQKHSHEPKQQHKAAFREPPAGQQAALMPLTGSVVELRVEAGSNVEAGDVLAVIEAMKMEHLVEAPAAGTVSEVLASEGLVLDEGVPVIFFAPSGAEAGAAKEEEILDPDHIRPDLAAVKDRLAILEDEHRPDAVERRTKKGQRTARANVNDLLDDGSFIEYGGLTLAARRNEVPLDDLIRTTQADAIITGIGAVNGDTFAPEKSRCAVMAVDYTVMAGTQGYFHHAKMDRLLGVAEQEQIPVVLYAEGGGGRPNDTDNRHLGAGGLDVPSFGLWAKLSGHVPRVAVVSGYCFAGNAALAGCADIIIATENANLGMGGPAMIEGGGLGVFKPTEVGPMSELVPNGVVDILVKDEEEATQVTKKYLSYFQGQTANASAPDQRMLRHAVPENRRRAYDMRQVIDSLCDDGSVLEIRPNYGIGVITCLVRMGGKPMGLIANNPMHLGGALDAEGSDKGARFLQLCEAFGLPVLSLCDTPGFMVGPDIEREAQVRRSSRLFVVGASLTVPVFSVVIRKSYGLGAMAMMAGGTKSPVFTVSWPTGEFGGMGLEGAIRLGMRRQLEAIEDEAERDALFNKLVAAAYEKGKALNTASLHEIDAVIDPADTRDWILRGLASMKPIERKAGSRGFIDTW